MWYGLIRSERMKQQDGTGRTIKKIFSWSLRFLNKGATILFLLYGMISGEVYFERPLEQGKTEVKGTALWKKGSALIKKSPLFFCRIDIPIYGGAPVYTKLATCTTDVSGRFVLSYKLESFKWYGFCIDSTAYPSSKPPYISDKLEVDSIKNRNVKIYLRPYDLTTITTHKVDNLPKYIIARSVSSFSLCITPWNRETRAVASITAFNGKSLLSCPLSSDGKVEFKMDRLSAGVYLIQLDIDNQKGKHPITTVVVQ